MRTLKENTKTILHHIAWLVSLASLPIALLMGAKGASPLQIVAWLSIVVLIMLMHLLPEALKEKEVYNDEL